MEFQPQTTDHQARFLTAGIGLQPQTTDHQESSTWLPNQAWMGLQTQSNDHQASFLTRLGWDCNLRLLITRKKLNPNQAGIVLEPQTTDDHHGSFLTRLGWDCNLRLLITREAS